jgi:glycosyltransferase involved in cell wall biosynthesis
MTADQGGFTGLGGATSGEVRADRAPRLILLIRRFRPLVGGMERQAERLAMGLAAGGAKVEVWTRLIAPGSPRSERLGNLTIHRLRPGGLGRMGEYGSLPFWYARLRWSRRRPALLAVFGSGWLALMAGLAARASGQPWLFRPATAGDLTRFLDPSAVPAAGPVRRWLRGNLPPAAWRADRLREADAVVAISEEIAAECLAWGFNPTSVHRIPNGVDCERFAPASAERVRELRSELSLPLEPPIALYLGRLVARKGLIELVEAWLDLYPPDADSQGPLLILAGSGEGQADSVGPQLRRLVQGRQDIRMVGEVAAPEAWLSAADLFCLPSHREGLSNALLEAMAAGRAILASDIPANRELLGGVGKGRPAGVEPDHESKSESSAGSEATTTESSAPLALLHPPGDRIAIAAGLSRLLSDAALRRRLGTAARSAVLARYDHRAVLERWLALLQTLTAESLARQSSAQPTADPIEPPA